jgi:hypothetical protein
VRLAVAFVAFAGCGRIGFAPSENGIAGDGQLLPDAPSDLPVCAVACTAEQFCGTPSLDCGGMPTCVTKPTSCPPTDAPVCGCDAKNYANECEANLAGVSVSLATVCPPVANPTCDPPCSNAQVCNTPLGVCNAQQGVCDPKPDPLDCDLGIPVCGCDLKSYISTCEAANAGASIFEIGNCSI